MEKSITINGREITKNQFVGAMLQYGDEEGYAYDPFDCAMTWMSFCENKVRGEQSYRKDLEGKTEQEIWLPLLEDYL